MDGVKTTVFLDKAKHEHASCEDTAHAANTQNQTNDLIFSFDSDPIVHLSVRVV